MTPCQYRPEIHKGHLISCSTITSSHLTLFPLKQRCWEGKTWSVGRFIKYIQVSKLLACSHLGCSASSSRELLTNRKHRSRCQGLGKSWHYLKTVHEAHPCDRHGMWSDLSGLDCLHWSCILPLGNALRHHITELTHFGGWERETGSGYTIKLIKKWCFLLVIPK